MEITNLLSRGFSRPDPFQSNWADGISGCIDFVDVDGLLRGGGWGEITSDFIGSKGWRLRLAANIGIDGFQGGNCKFNSLILWKLRSYVKAISYLNKNGFIFHILQIKKYTICCLSIYSFVHLKFNTLSIYLSISYDYTI